MRQPRLHRSGFTILPSVINAPELAALCTRVDAKLHQPVPAGCERPNNTLAPLRWNDHVVASLLGGRDLVARIGAACEARDLKWISGYISVKDAASPPLGWHQDWWCWSHPVSFRARPSQIAVLCYLADTHARAGALRVLPGTHRRSIELHRALRNDESEPRASRADAVALRDQRNQVTVAVRAGDAVVIDYRLLHGTHANEAPTRRDCVILNFAPDWSDLPDDVRAHLIRHSALPRAGEAAPEVFGGLLPRYDGTPRDLELARIAPAEFSIGSAV